MVSARVKNFLINLAIASVLAGFIFAGFLFRKQILELAFRLNKNRPINIQKGTSAILITPSGKIRKNIIGVVKEILDDKFVLENEGTIQTIWVNSEMMTVRFSKDDYGTMKGEGSALRTNELSNVLKAGEAVNVVDSYKENGRIFAKKILVFPWSDK